MWRIGPALMPMRSRESKEVLETEDVEKVKQKKEEENGSELVIACDDHTCCNDDNTCCLNEKLKKWFCCPLPKVNIHNNRNTTATSHTSSVSITPATATKRGDESNSTLKYDLKVLTLNMWFFSCRSS